MEAAERTRADGKQRVAELTEELAESERTRAALAQTVRVDHPKPHHPHAPPNPG